MLESNYPRVIKLSQMKLSILLIWKVFFAVLFIGIYFSSESQSVQNNFYLNNSGVGEKKECEVIPDSIVIFDSVGNKIISTKICSINVKNIANDDLNNLENIGDGLLDFPTLLNYHKQEAAEEMSYITTFITVLLGIIGYLGAVKSISLKARMAFVIVFLFFSFAIYQSVSGGLKMHDAIHSEIDARVERNNYFIKPQLKEQMEYKNVFQKGKIITGFVIIDIFMVAAILFIGDRKESSHKAND